MQGIFYALRQITNNCMRRRFGRQVSRVAVILDMTRPLDVYDLRKSLIGRLTAIDRRLPLVCYQIARSEYDDIRSRNREMIDRLDLDFDSEILLDDRSLQEDIRETVDDLRRVD